MGLPAKADKLPYEEENTNYRKDERKEYNERRIYRKSPSTTSERGALLHFG
jgi:hypothetical protein